MKYLDDEKVTQYLSKTVEVAKNATCERSRCGAIIVSKDEIIGCGFNSPPQNIEEQRRCQVSKDSYHKKVTDKTCCVHAEQRAIMDAMKNNSNKLANSRLYFIRLNEKEEPSIARQPYCTICSKMALDVGIKEFVLWHEKGAYIYDTKEYNTISFQFGVDEANKE